MKLHFTKMQGAGNDFVVCDATQTAFELTKNQLLKLTDRRFGVGCDQVLVVEKPELPEADFKYRIINADGSEVEMCGNGARCFVKFVVETGLTTKRKIVCQTKAGLITPELLDNGDVRVHMGIAHFREEEIPIDATYAKREFENGVPIYECSIADKPYRFSAVSMGNPHAVLVVESTEGAPVSLIGEAFQHHRLFPNRVNVGFMQILDRTHIRLRVFERGAGETLACGTGASAAVVSGIRRGLLEHCVQVLMKGGMLTIEWNGAESDPVYLSGPAETTFKGEINL